MTLTDTLQKGRPSFVKGIFVKDGGSSPVPDSLGAQALTDCLPGQRTEAPKVAGSAAHLMGHLASAHAPTGEAGAAPGGGMAQGGVSSCSWDPALWAKSKLVSCYSGLQFYDGRLCEIPISPLPGTGFTKPECHSFVRTIKAGQKVERIFHSCDRLSCPTCLPETLTKKARDAQRRFEEYESLILDENTPLISGEKRGIKPRHLAFTITPRHQEELIAKVKCEKPGDWETWHNKRFLEIFREEYNNCLKIAGLLGGMSVYHDKRLRHPGTASTGQRAKMLITREAKIAGNMRDDSPSWMLYDHIRKQKNWKEYCYFSPHFHFTGYGKALDAREFEERCPGWTYHNKGTVPNPGGLARYLFSHEAMIEESHSVTWTGRLSSRVLGHEEIRTYEVPQCDDETGLPWIVINSIYPGEIGRIYYLTVTEYKPFFRKMKRGDPPDPVLKFPGTKRTSAPGGIRDKGEIAYLKCGDGEVLYNKDLR